MKVVVVYEFTAQLNSGELSIVPQEILTGKPFVYSLGNANWCFFSFLHSVTRQDVGDGWWEGVNSRDEKGLFPAEYVTPVDDSANHAILTSDPWIPAENSLANNASPAKPGLVSFSNPIPVSGSNINQPPPPPAQQQSPQSEQYDGDWGDDDWDDDDSQASEFTTGDVSSAMTPHGQLAAIHVNAPGGGKQQSQQATVKKSMNRFSHFVKSGGEDYILGLKTYNVNQHDLIHIIDENNIFKWSPGYFTYTVSVENPKKESKMKGLKSYIAYQVRSCSSF